MRWCGGRKGSLDESILGECCCWIRGEIVGEGKEVRLCSWGGICIFVHGLELWEGYRCSGLAMHDIKGVIMVSIIWCCLWIYVSWWSFWQNSKELVYVIANWRIMVICAGWVDCRLHSINCTQPFFSALVAILFERLTCTRLFYKWVDWSQNILKWHITILKVV